MNVQKIQIFFSFSYVLATCKELYNYYKTIFNLNNGHNLLCDDTHKHKGCLLTNILTSSARERSQRRKVVRVSIVLQTPTWSYRMNIKLNIATEHSLRQQRCNIL